MYGSSSAAMPPNFCTSSVVSATRASITSSTVTMPSTRPSVSTTGTASRSYLEMSRATSSRSVRGETVRTFRALATSTTCRDRSLSISSLSETTCRSAPLAGSTTYTAYTVSLAPPTRRMS
jgi:hypothetical protein